VCPDCTVFSVEAKPHIGGIRGEDLFKHSKVSSFYEDEIKAIWQELEIIKKEMIK